MCGRLRRSRFDGGCPQRIDTLDFSGAFIVVVAQEPTLNGEIALVGLGHHVESVYQLVLLGLFEHATQHHQRGFVTLTFLFNRCHKDVG